MAVRFVLRDGAVHILEILTETLINEVQDNITQSHTEEKPEREGSPCYFPEKKTR